MNDHLSPVGKPAAARPRRPDAFISSMIQSRPMPSSIWSRPSSRASARPSGPGHAAVEVVSEDAVAIGDMVQPLTFQVASRRRASSPGDPVVAARTALEPFEPPVTSGGSRPSRRRLVEMEEAHGMEHGLHLRPDAPDQFRSSAASAARRRERGGAASGPPSSTNASALGATTLGARVAELVAIERGRRRPPVHDGSSRPSPHPTGERLDSDSSAAPTAARLRARLVPWAAGPF